MPGKLSRIEIVFEDNRRLAGVLGSHDAHLALIERKFSLKASGHGNIVVLEGDADACEMARTVLETLYRRAETEVPVPADVEGVIRHTIDASSAAAADGAVAGSAAAEELKTSKRVVIARTPTQSAYVKALASHDMVFATGPAGTGKTYIGVVYAAGCLQRGEVERIILSRPAVEAGERLGFLPGDLKEKVDPYLRPLYDALYDVMAADKIERALENKTIEIAPLAFMRGRTLKNAVVVLDEAQNCTPMQMKMFLTRLGENSKMIVTGDPSQVDLPPGQKSGLAEAIDILRSVDGIAHIAFTRADVVRHALVGRIIEAYEQVR